MFLKNINANQAFKIGYVCAYYVPEGYAWLAKLQLEKISEFTQYNFKVYGVDIRLPGETRSLLLQHSNVDLQLGQQHSFANREHAAALKLGCQRAIDDGCDVVVTLDVDSFPISPDWSKFLCFFHQGNHEVAAIQRTENGDTYLTHPSMIAIKKSFLQRSEFDFYPDPEFLSTPEMKQFQEATKQSRTDTGIGLAYELWRKGAEWTKLERSNMTNFHYLMGGVYGDLIYHVGAMSRAPLFAKDFDSPLGKIALKLKSTPLLWRVYNQKEKRVRAMNSRQQMYIEEQTRNNLDNFLRELLGREV